MEFKSVSYRGVQRAAHKDMILILDGFHPTMIEAVNTPTVFSRNEGNFISATFNVKVMAADTKPCETYPCFRNFNCIEIRFGFKVMFDLVIEFQLWG